MDRCFRKREDMITRDIGGEIVLMPGGQGGSRRHNVYALNPTASFIWEQIDGKRSVREICEELVAEFDVDREQAEHELMVCIGMLLDIDCIVQDVSGR